MGLEDDLAPPESTPDELRVGPMIANLAQDPTDAARARIMAAVRSTPTPAAAARRRLRLGHRLRLSLVGFGATGLLISACAGALAASSDALPSSPVYGLRNLQEDLRVAVASPREQPRLRLQFAARKLEQAEVLVSKGEVGDAAKLLNDSKHDLEQAQTELQDLHDPSAVVDLAAETSRLQADVVSQQGQVETIQSGGNPAPAPASSSQPPAAGSSVPAPDASAVAPANPAASPESNPAGSPDNAPTP